MKKVWSDFIKSFTRESNARDFYNAYKFAFVGDLTRAFLNKHFKFGIGRIVRAYQILRAYLE